MKSLSLLFDFSFQQWLYCLGILVGSGILCSFFIHFYIQNTRKIGVLIKNIFFSRTLVFCFLFSLFDLLCVVFLYGINQYAYFFGVVLLFLFVMSYIDCLLLMVPDFINFACLIFVFMGLYFMGELKEENWIASLSVAGGISILRIFGNFIFKKEIMGEADVIVLASMGAILLLIPSFYLIFLASVLAMVYILLVSFVHFKEKQISVFTLKIPFVLFLSLAFVVLTFYQHFFGEICV